MRIAPAAVAGWSPGIHLSDAVAPTERLEGAVARFAAGFEAPAIVFSDPGGLVVPGSSWVVIGADGGLRRDTTHLLNDFRWRDAFAGLGDTAAMLTVTAPALVLGTLDGGNHFHWLLQSLGPALMAQSLGLDPATTLLLPTLSEAQRNWLAALGIANPVVELPDDTLAVLDQGIATSLNGGLHGFAPHPAMLALFREACPALGERHHRRRLYVSRRDARNPRGFINEEALCVRLAALGFEILSAGTLSPEAQIAAYREAEVIVAPHGAGLTNLVWSGDGNSGPRVIELFGENYLNRCFIKICQAKGLRYRAVVNRCVDPGRHHHHSRGEIDIPLVEAAIDAG